MSALWNCIHMSMYICTTLIVTSRVLHMSALWNCIHMSILIITSRVLHMSALWNYIYMSMYIYIYICTTLIITSRVLQETRFKWQIDKYTK